MTKTSLSEADRQKVMVLVVDDMAANRSVLCRQLELHKYNAMSVDSGEAALELLTRIRPDIMLLDYMMPNMNGIEVLRHLRADPATVDLPVIMVTARAENQATVEALEAGADDYVTKPIDYVVLRARIDSQLQKQGNASDLRMSNAALDEKVTMRNLVLADLESELKSEIALRLKHEQELAKRSARSIQSPPSKTLADLPLVEINQKFNVVFDSVVAGKTPNLALIYELKELLNQLVIEGS
ncbi:PleD family two-component system response regulator [Croceicoccus sp. YJ47]|uniref:response regulator n=1 Tax=Croceicoccus sp. YJ47 TaxID=2798724 RepID=UPI001922C6C9|nr:response regulator [Croceicoccus sp. YJ47]QQN74297.1 response regulator [Croceicoccus sp. YJ47]